MATRKKDTNIWNKNRNSNKSSVGKFNPANQNVNSPTPAEQKFKEAQGKLQAAIRKHVQDYESSSEEEELESENIIDGIVKNYTSTGGKNESLGRTKAFLKDSFLSGTATCLICISRIKRDAEVWNCNECYCVIHLNCIQRWSKDTIYQQKQIQESPIQVRQVTLTWCCPKCRRNYQIEDIPDRYLCFCGKTKNPKLQPFLVPHSCGEICGKSLIPTCGHKCLLLCHPGPCPPCPVTIAVSCYCGSQQPVTRRCSDKEWSCGNRCGKLLSCQKHSCSEPCHFGTCKPCPKKSLQNCMCKTNRKLRDCATPEWRCDKICNKPLSCGNHNCSVICHDGACDPCPLTEVRSCPCGKSKYQLPCTEETPTCQDTCEKILSCGLHTCNQRCHKETCGVCLEIVEKACKCGLHSKEVQCYKPYSCETKCKRMKDCNKHPCNKKCCDGNCPPCEKPCARTLNCGNHKCTSVCHRGLCYPCNQTETVTCRCGQTKITVPCGRKHKTKPPKCNQLCTVPPDCHHEARERHKCHFGDCPPCRQICSKQRLNCNHLCSFTCHSAVMVKIEAQKPSMPWEQTEPQIERKSLPCPACEEPVTVTCLGGHETSDWPCHRAVPSSCHRPCGRSLKCENHICTFSCHVVENAPDGIKAGKNCEVCESPCTKERPEGCQHECPKPCHPGPCPPCKQMLRIRCHCGLNQPYVACSEWLVLEKREEIKCCGNQCPKNFECGHRCRTNCHSGPCPNSELCRRKVKVTCKCKRLKKEFSCELMRSNVAKVECDEVCAQKKSEERRLQQIVSEQKRREEELRNEKELAKYKKLFENKKKGRERRLYDEIEEVSFIKKYWFIITSTTTLHAGLQAAMNNEDLYIVGAEFTELKYDGFWDWFVRISDIRIFLKNEPTYLISQLAFILGGLATLFHAIIRGGRLPYLWLGILIHGVVVECMCYILPDIDNFWHSQTPVIFLGRRLPLHIMFLYPCFIYNSSIGVAKMRLPLWAEPLAVGLGVVLIDIPYDIISVNFLHWTWHDTDPNIADRHYWVPWNSYYFHTTFAASFTFWFHFTRKYICNSEGKWVPDKSRFKEILCSIIPGVLGTPGGILLFLPIYHPLHDIFKIHSEVTYFILLVISLLIIWSADRAPKQYANEKKQQSVHWTTFLLIFHLIVHYTSFLLMPVFFNPEDEIAIGLKEPIGPCNEHVPIQTAFGMTLQKRKYLCATDYDEKYFDWHCLPNNKPPSIGSQWYTACGVPFPNRVEMIVIVALICFAAATIFGNMHFGSHGDNVFSEKADTKLSSKKIKKH
ncbi:hypothetical protein Zmor_006522 [Zophobas morio]|uniref:RING-type domain-containing protein n=1 Tax=Zophobas morio TaxID=2755281 RepID=A0AA38MMU1_9CUCU|nr:hypothetical protein Zmor_006522 [Zophobas morio]